MSHLVCDWCDFVWFLYLVDCLNMSNILIPTIASLVATIVVRIVIYLVMTSNQSPMAKMSQEDKKRYIREQQLSQFNGDVSAVIIGFIVGLLLFLY